MEGNVLFNDALNTFYLRLYGVSPSDGVLYKNKRKQNHTSIRRKKITIMPQIERIVQLFSYDWSHWNISQLSAGVREAAIFASHLTMNCKWRKVQRRILNELTNTYATSQTGFCH